MNGTLLIDSITKEYEIYGITMTGGAFVILLSGLLVAIAGILTRNKQLIISGLISYSIGAYTTNCVIKGNCTYWNIFLIARILIITLIFGMIAYPVFK